MHCLQVTHWQHPNFHAYFPAGNSFPSILGDMLSNAIGCVGFSWVGYFVSILSVLFRYASHSNSMIRKVRSMISIFCFCFIYRQQVQLVLNWRPQFWIGLVYMFHCIIVLFEILNEEYMTQINHIIMCCHLNRSTALSIQAFTIICLTTRNMLYLKENQLVCQNSFCTKKGKVEVLFRYSSSDTNVFKSNKRYKPLFK